jgi:hypothetical protein
MRLGAGLLLAGVTLGSCNDKACPPLVVPGGRRPSPQWVHKGALVIRDEVAQLPASVASQLTCPLKNNDAAAATAAAAASNTLASQASGDTIDQNNCASIKMPGDATSYWRLNDAKNGPAYLFHSKGNRDVFFTNSNGVNTIIYWPQ